MAEGLVIAAPASGSGKTLVTSALIAAYRRAGLSVAAAKVGPDYIDPRFHAAATGRAAPNLDPWAMRAETIAGLIELAGSGSDLLIVEGVMGLFDGPPRACGSTADLAAMLGLPVVLVIDAERQGQSVAALARGFADFRHDVPVAGVMLNRVATPRHADLLSFALREANVEVFGAVPRDAKLTLPSRHLGLVQAEEHENLAALFDRAADVVERSVGLAKLRRAARTPRLAPVDAAPLAPLGQRMAVASDQAFAFAYPHLLDGWRRAGAELSFFSPLADERPEEDVDAVFLPGGYPELHAERLAGNRQFLEGLRSTAASGALVYGECGGFMVLGEGLVDAAGKGHAMAGLLPLETSFARRKLHLGYRRMRHRNVLPLPGMLRGHEFHYSTIGRQGEAEPLFDLVEDSSGASLGQGGIRRGRVMGSYLHIIDAEAA